MGIMAAYISTDLKLPIFQIKNQANSTCFNKLKLNSHIIINKKYKTYCKIKMDDLNDFEDSELDPETRKLREKQAEIERLRAAEKFMEIDEGKFECQACGYIYEPETGINLLEFQQAQNFHSFQTPSRALHVDHLNLNLKI